ncbi:MAG: carboxypeptidase regulatory-like domain-containing protein [Candidatus Heimdallarchaeota archaeon]|nr:carboxypeptidase regulatory-like domain-containing protein [Candidatus Heimdallarchaeota archaeon]
MIGNKKRNSIFFICVLFTILIAPSIINTKAFDLDPGDPPPANTSVNGYVKDGLTNSKLYNARVAIYNRYTGAYYGYDYTDSNGYFTFSSVPDVDHKIYITKSGYISQWYNVYSNGVTYTIDPSITVTIQGDIRENEILDNIEVPFTSPGTLDINPDGLEGYSNLINDISISIKVYDWRNNLIRSFTTTSGIYNTGSFSIRKGTITVKATSTTSIGRHFIQGVTSFYASSSTTYTKNFVLDRDLGTLTVSADSEGIENMNDFSIKLSPTNSHYVFISLNAKHIPNLFYHPYNSLYSENVIETSYRLTSFQGSGGAYFTAKNVKQTLYAYNHWSEEESFMALDGLTVGITGEGTGRQCQWSINGETGWCELWEVIMNFGVTLTPPSYDIIHKSQAYEELGFGCKLGSVEIDYTEDWQTINKLMSSQWEIFLDNTNYKPHKQCGSHITFKVVTEITYEKCLYGVWGVANPNGPWVIVFEQTLGDNQIVHPDYTFIEGTHDGFIEGEVTGHDFWMNLFAGIVEDLPM